ncbi:phenolic acid decarboxylase [Commensalibacter oyaizuii]|uniref:Phenolic acid decarboxylase n=1 Tax=Commensalibacter oyaizuii TaxID=3043873 RepID=A0ABT6Q0J2_9PROT|nr:phenolic acid decarboxylase [Commensalibacter sp. TBRC 16381]MDI2090637.1 phenolic acid decarboxylase [Commensalibacter sp. TBRC 16381]
MPTFDKKDLSDFLGKHLVFTYDNGWNYELYIKNAKKVDFRVHSGIIGNRWVKNQDVYIARIAKKICKLSWTEPTGTNVSIIINLENMLYQGTIFFPRWIINDPEKASRIQDDRIPLMEFYREIGPTYPIEILDEFAAITFVQDCSQDDESVIECSADELPADFLENLKKSL